MPGFTVEVQGEEIGVSITVLHKSNSSLPVARQELAKAYGEAASQLIKRLEDKNKVDAHLEFLATPPLVLPKIQHKEK